MSTIPSVNTEGYTSPNGAVGFKNNDTNDDSLWKHAPVLEALCDPFSYHVLYDDCYENVYTVVGDGSATIAEGDGAGGIISVTPGATTDNDEAYLVSGAESWIFDTTKELYFEAYLAVVEGDTDKANVIVGLMDAAGANSLLDNGAGPAASYDGAVFFKVDGGTAWQFETSNAGTQVTNTNVATVASLSFIRLGFIYDPNDGVTGKITPYINGVAGTTHDITISGLQEMHLVAGVKNGSTAVNSVAIDYIKIIQER